MPEVIASRVGRRRSAAASFTLVEMLTVMTIILILAALLLNAAWGVMNRSLRSRATSEIQAMTTALDAYKIDNGSYPATNYATHAAMSSSLLTNTIAVPYFFTTLDGSGPAYINNSQTIYQALSGQTNFTDVPVPNMKVYIAFKINQAGDPKGTVSGATYVMDPWKMAYGYSIGTTNNAPSPSYPYNGQGFFDLWSTSGLKASTTANTNTWISNWH